MRLEKGSSQPPTVVELKPDTTLLDLNFSGYKLSLLPIPVQTVTFESRVDKVGPCEGQFSLQHATLFATQNLLFVNPFAPKSVYFVDKDWSVWKVTTNPLNGRMCPPVNVWIIPGRDKGFSGRFNVSIVFPSSAYSLLADGCGNVFLLNVNDDDSKKWEVAFQVSSEPVKSTVILDSVFHTEVESDRIDLLLMRIEEKANFIEEHQLQHHENLLAGDHAFLNVIEWISLKKGRDNPWATESKRILAGQTGVHYGYLERGGNSIYIASDAPFHFTFDSEQPVLPPRTEERKPDIEKKPDYLWSQAKEKVTVWFSLAVSSGKEDVQVSVQSESITVSYNNEVILEGSLHKSINPDSLEWSLESGKLEILLVKSDGSMNWTELVVGNLVGEQILDEEIVQSIHSRLAHLCTDKWESNTDNVLLTENDFDEQLEECDRLSDDLALLMRFTKSSHNITHQASLTTHPVLFAVRVDPLKAPFVCLRFHHDGLIWQSEESDAADPVWALKHVGTFSALGYVQAGKSQRKFTVCAPDLSYVALCDGMKHIYIYRQPEALANQLRNRKTGAHVKHIASQQVIAVEPPLELLGSVASDELLFVLTANHLHAYRVREGADDEEI